MGKYLQDQRLYTSQSVFNGGQWRIERLFGYYSEVLDKTIFLLEGGTFDKNSTPWLFRLLVPKCGTNLDAPSALHDLPYMSEALERKECDLLYKEAAEDAKANTLMRFAAFRAVRRFGWVVWLKHTPESIAAAKPYIVVLDGYHKRLPDGYKIS